jgi:hypothetical protein
LLGRGQAPVRRSCPSIPLSNPLYASTLFIGRYCSPRRLHQQLQSLTDLSTITIYITLSFCNVISIKFSHTCYVVVMIGLCLCRVSIHGGSESLFIVSLRHSGVSFQIALSGFLNKKTRPVGSKIAPVVLY